MNNLKIIKFLSSLSRSELREFGKFVKSSFHNKRRDVVRYFDVVKEHYPKFDSAELTSDKIFRKLYPASEFDPNVIVLLNSYLYNLAKEYCAVKELREEKFFHDFFVLKSLDRHFADDLFEKEFRSARVKLEEEKYETDSFMKKSLLENLLINYKLRRNKQEETCKSTFDYADYIFKNFIISFSETYHGLLANKSSFNYDFDDSVLNLFADNFDFGNILKLQKEMNFKDYDYIAYYLYLFMCNYDIKNQEYFRKLKEFSFKNFDELSVKEKQSRFNYLIDYCIYRMELGDMEYLQESFDLYTEALEKRIFQTNPDKKSIGVMFFRNFVSIGLAAGESDYVENFISAYGNEIQGELKNDLLELSYAMLFYEKSQYDKSLECISRMTSIIPLFKLSTKFLLTKIYYDTDQFDSLFSLIDTYKHYIKHDKIIPKRTREVHSTFLNQISRLAKFKSTGNFEELAEFKRELEENKSTDYRHKIWLMKKGDELGKTK